MTYRLKQSLGISYWLLLVAGFSLSGGCGRATGPKGLSDSTYAATRKAVDALELASEDRNASASTFGPKFQAASRATDEVYNSMGSQRSDGYAVDQLRSCIEEMKMYRSNFESRESISRPIQEQLKGLKGAQIKDSNDVVARTSRDLDECVQAAKEYL